MSDLLRTRPASTLAMLAVWDDDAAVRHALAFEVALAHAQAAAGVITNSDAATIASTTLSLEIDLAALAEEVAFAGTFAIPLVGRIRAAAGVAAASVHRGATSQDVADTVLMLQVKAATTLLRRDVARIAVALARHARTTAATPAVGRTLLQDALPIGFGLRVAQWHRGVVAAGARVEREVEEGARLQLGGAAGTRAGMDGKGAAVSERLAAALSLGASPPWHGRRDAVAAISAAVAILVGTLAKMARDVALLAQNAIAEAREPVLAGRGGSSAMAHKRNPTGCQVALTAATRAPGLVAAVLAAMPGEAERSLGGWQAESPVLADLFLLAAGAAAAMADVAEGLEIDRDAIARNLAHAGLGHDIGESELLVDQLLEE